MGKIRKPFEHAKEVLVPGTTKDLHIADAALRTERTKPCALVATLEDRRYRVATERMSERRREFAGDSALEGGGFESSVPVGDSSYPLLTPICSRKRGKALTVARIHPLFNSG
jgi:hypothetical protein